MVHKDNITRNMSVPSAITGSRDSARFFTQPKVLVIVATVCCLLWGSSYPAIKIGYALLGITQSDIPSKLIFAGYRFVLAGLLLLILAALSKKPVFDLNRRNSGQLMLLGFTQTAIQYVFFYIGLAYTTGVRGSILNSTTTFFSVLLAAEYATGGSLHAFTLGSMALLAHLALLSAAAFTLWSLLLKYNQLGKVTVFNFLVPVFGTMLAAICLNENIMELKNLVALVLVCGGIWLVTRSAQRGAGYSKAGVAVGAQGRG
jgi:drug/metabolite transporter (DMT)-like permease